MPLAALVESTESSSRGDIQLLNVPQEGVLQAWPLVEPLIARAAAQTRKCNLSHLRSQLAEGGAQLWAIWEPTSEAVLAAFVTTLQSYPTGWNTARVVLLGGERMESWRHLLRQVEEWARSEGCDALEIVGRKGWQRVFPDYEHCETLISKEF